MRVIARAWGAGAGWALDAVPALLGAGDDPSGFAPQHDVVTAAHRRFGGYRVPASRLVVDALVPAVIEQKVTGKEAFAAYRRLVRRYGEPAPDPAARRPARPSGWAAIPSWEWLQGRGRAVPEPDRARRGRPGGRLEECVAMDPVAARRRLESLPGVGVWTSGEVASRALGDADAVSVGDYHVARSITWALVGEELDDAAMLELLEPYAGHRYRVQRLLELVGIDHPAVGRDGPCRPTSPVGPAASEQDDLDESVGRAGEALVAGRERRIDAFGADEIGRVIRREPITQGENPPGDSEIGRPSGDPRSARSTRASTARGALR